MRSLPSLKDKRRYIVFEIISEKRHGFEQVKQLVINAVSQHMGMSGLARSKPKLLQDKWDQDKQKGIICVDRKYVHNVKAALCLSNPSSNEMIRSVGTSGILKKAIERHY